MPRTGTPACSGLTRRKCLLLTHAATLFSVFETDVRAVDLRATRRLVTGLVERELCREGLPSATFGNLRSQELILAKTADRSVLGCMNDMAFPCEVAISDAGGLAHCDLGELNHALHRYTPANSAGRSAGRKCPSAPKLTARSKAPAKGRARTSARTHPAPGCARRARASMPVLKSTPVTGPWHRDARTRMPAPVPQHTSSPRPNAPARLARRRRVRCGPTRTRRRGPPGSGRRHGRPGPGSYGGSRQTCGPGPPK